MILSTFLTSGSALAADASQWEGSAYDDAGLRAPDAEAQAGGTGGSVEYDDVRMGPGEVTGAVPGAKPVVTGDRAFKYDDIRMELAEQ